MQKHFELLLIFLRLGLTSFGGPVAHLGFFRQEFVQRRKWFTEAQYADKVALCQLIPGPASSQVGLLIGYERGGYLGALLAWIGFTLPSALFLGILGVSVVNYGELIPHSVLVLLKAIALAVVLQAVIGMAKAFCSGSIEIGLISSAALISLLVSSPWIAPLVILGAAGFYTWTKKSSANPEPISLSHMKWKHSITWLTLFIAGLMGLPLVSHCVSGVESISDFYRAGALVFGGGHVVLPLLSNAFVDTGIMQHETFLAGYAAAQAVPGPLFTFASFIGGSVSTNIFGATIATLAIFAPAVFILFGVYPIWKMVQQQPRIRLAVAGANSAVVGLLLAAFISMSIEATHTLYLGVILAGAYLLLDKLKVPAWLLVLSAIPLGLILERFVL